MITYFLSFLILFSVNAIFGMETLQKGNVQVVNIEEKYVYSPKARNKRKLTELETKKWVAIAQKNTEKNGVQNIEKKKNEKGKYYKATLNNGLFFASKNNALYFLTPQLMISLNANAYYPLLKSIYKKRDAQ